MDCTDLPRDRLEKLFEQLGPHLAYFGRLQDRLSKRGLPPDDKLLAAATAAHDAVHHLRVMAHYLACEGGVGRSSTRNPK